MTLRLNQTTDFMISWWIASCFLLSYFDWTACNSLMYFSFCFSIFCNSSWIFVPRRIYHCTMVFCICHIHRNYSMDCLLTVHKVISFYVFCYIFGLLALKMGSCHLPPFVFFSFLFMSCSFLLGG